MDGPFLKPKRDSSTAHPGPQIAESAICGKENRPGCSAQNDERARKAGDIVRAPRGTAREQSQIMLGGFGGDWLIAVEAGSRAFPASEDPGAEAPCEKNADQEGVLQGLAHVGLHLPVVMNHAGDSA